MARGAFKVNKLFYGMGGERVGLASAYVVDGINTIQINVRDKDGKVTRRGEYQMLGTKIRTYPKHQYPNVPEQYYVPVGDLQINEQPKLFEGL